MGPESATPWYSAWPVARVALAKAKLRFVACGTVAVESDGTVCAIAPFPIGTARIVTGRFTNTEPFSKTVPCTRTGIGLNTIGTIVRSPAGCNAGIARLVYPAADTEPA